MPRASEMTVRSGAGTDTIFTGSGEDRIDPGAGIDAIHTGAAYDEVLATEAPDGPDLYDLGPETGKIDYSRRQDPVVLKGQRVGAIGEDDQLAVGLLWLVAGSGNDTLAGGEGHDLLEGNDGDDSLRGAGGKDELIGGRGEDRLYGEAGRDLLVGEPGGDLLVGGTGNNELDCGQGRRDSATANIWDSIRGCETVQLLRPYPLPEHPLLSPSCR